MKKLLTIITISILGCVMLPVVQPLHAGSIVSVRLEQPKSPTNSNTFPLTFVALDLIGERPFTASCWKKSPTDTDFVQFGSTIPLLEGGNTATCDVTSSILSTSGLYKFKTTVVAGSDTSESETVTVSYNDTTPGDPRDYRKEQLDSCTYKLFFKAADDAGKTIKIEIYRSSDTSFTADSSTRVGTLAATSNQQPDFANTVPDCGKEYYYVVRAFDTSGNGSGTVGDSVAKVTTTTKTVTSTTTQTTTNTGETTTNALVVPEGAGIVEGATTTTGETAGTETQREGTVLGEQQENPEVVELSNKKTSILNFFKTIFNNRFVQVGSIFLVIGLIWYARSKKNTSI